MYFDIIIINNLNLKYKILSLKLVHYINNVDNPKIYITILISNLIKNY